MDDTRSLVSNGELMIYGEIDPYCGVRAIDVIDSISELQGRDTLRVRINSPGGSAMEGLAIHNALRASGKRVVVMIDAIAASIASIIAMAGDEIVIAENATLMIHDPWAMAIGTSEELREQADENDRQKKIMVDIYAKRTGLTTQEVEALMSAETYMSAQDALAKGFVDKIDIPLAVAACATLDKQKLAQLLAARPTVRAESPKPAAPAASLENAMSTRTVSPGGGNSAAVDADAIRAEALTAERERVGAISSAVRAAQLEPEFADDLIRDGLTIDQAREKISAKVAAKQTDPIAVRAEATRVERERHSGITAAVRAAKLEPAFGDDLIRQGLSVEQARQKIWDKWAEVQAAAAGGNAPSNPQVRISEDGVDKWIEGATKGLMARVNMKGGERNEFSGLTLSELARTALNVRNIKNGQMSRMEMVGRAFTVMAAGPGYHSTSDFGNVLSSVAYRSMMVGYNEVDETFPLWTGKGIASDFRPISRVDMGLFPALDKVEEGAEYTYATIGDSGVTVQVATYGKLFAITRQAIVNDDLGFFDRVPRRMGRAAKRTIGNLVYAILNGNPTMQDGVALFHATHGNLAGTAAVPSVVSIGAMQAGMAVQKDDAGIGTGGGTRAKFLLLPPALEMTANIVITSETIPGDAGQVKNPIRGTVTPISDSRLSGTAWYAAADPSQTDTIEVTYLDGVEEPFMDQKEGWNVDGSEFKVRMDAGVKALHWRGLAKNAGV
jgi:ATP-dependent protease ClpP protease subunit